jgi:hypothetical protein
MNPLALLSFWKEGLIVLLLAAAWYFHSDDVFTHSKLDTLQLGYDTSQSDLKAARDKIVLFEKAADDGQKALKVSEQKRLTVISNLNNQIAALRKQEPPKECTAAVEWAITHSSELNWTK